MELGIFNELEILRETSVGLFLGDKEDNDVLLPIKYMPKEYEIGDMLSVFLYTDSEDRLIATNLQPTILLHEVKNLEVMAVSKFGAFLDWGLEKHLFVPFKEQRSKMEVGQKHLVYMYQDEQTFRLAASAKVEGFFSNEELTVEENEKVEIQFIRQSELGYTVIVNNKHLGLVYDNEILSRVYLGDVREGYIKKIREDNRLDISAHAKSVISTEPNADLILDRIKLGNGFTEFTDKSHPEDIYDAFGISKKAFKKAVGYLYKNKLIELKPDGIYLVK